MVVYSTTHFGAGSPPDWLIRAIFKNDVVNLPYLVSSIFGKNYSHSQYMQVYRWVKRLNSKGYIDLKKIDGLLWIYPQKSFFDLIKRREKNSNFVKSVYVFPKRSHPLRIEAIKTILNHKILDSEILDDLRFNFNLYLGDISSKKIVLRKKDDAPIGIPEFLFLDYRTRFNSKSYVKKLLKRFERVFYIACRHYNYAVFLTLTTDPKRFSSLWHANRHFSVAFNRFLSFLAKRLGSRPKYLCIYEFTKSGLLHAHVIIFGVSYLIDKFELTKYWAKCNQGKITYIYRLKKKGDRWVWLKKRPRGAKYNQGIKDYLKKYLRKGFADREGLQTLYWVFNKRFFSCSRVFIKVNIKVVKVTYYYFLGCWRLFELPNVLFDYYYRGLSPPIDSTLDT